MSAVTALLPRNLIMGFSRNWKTRLGFSWLKWWAWQGLNLRPLRCQGRHTSQNPQKISVFRCSLSRTRRERMRNRAPVYRSFTAPQQHQNVSTRRQHCYYCGEDIGPWDRFSDRYDTCGRHECERDARDAIAAERDEAHEQLDRDMGWSW